MARVEDLDGRKVVHVSGDPERGAQPLSMIDGATIASGARLALAARLPLVVSFMTSGASVTPGLDALAAWGNAARAVAACSGVVPVCMVITGPALSGPALLIGLADVVVMTPDAFAFVCGPGMVADFTGVEVSPAELGGASVHARRTGVATLLADDPDDALVLVAEVLDFLPDHCDALPVRGPNYDPAERPTPELRDVLPASERGSYDVRKVAEAIVDEGELMELRAGWAPQLVTALGRIDGRAVGLVANQPQSMAGTLDIAASQKGARFVAFCDAFNLAIVTLVDTSGFLPGKDLEWRGMIRHGAELVFAYARATVPRICIILRKAYGGAYIVMDSAGMGNDLCLAWPSAEVAVMGAAPAVQILYRREDADSQERRVAEYRAEHLTPWKVTDRSLVDVVIDPAETRAVLSDGLAMLATKRERLVRRRHDNSPL